ncbi:uncharacterized protein LOC135493410 isoform X1 [Lineus longissimus]|uniref:uncharacterized protein LOC135493410 isoform X1 n=1 Tax=Lineus longissimus TaxID=88925 RepID=UPI002B4E0E03
MILKNSGMQEGGVVDIKDIVNNYARSWYERKFQKALEKKFGKLPWDRLSVETDNSRLIIEHEKATYEQEKSGLGTCSPRYSVLFKSNYNNTTDGTLHYEISTERRTRTSVALTITEGFRYGGSFEVKLAPPSLECSLGFSSEISFEKSVQTTKEQEVVWTLNTTVDVPPCTCTTVELVVRDDEYDGRFRIRSFFSGEIHVNIRKENTNLTTITISNLGQILTEEMGFKRDPITKRLYFDTHGVCNCRYGVEQDVRTSNTPIAQKES